MRDKTYHVFLLKRFLSFILNASGLTTLILLETFKSFFMRPDIFQDL